MRCAEQEILLTGVFRYLHSGGLCLCCFVVVVFFLVKKPIPCPTALDILRQKMLKSLEAAYMYEMNQLIGAFSYICMTCIPSEKKASRNLQVGIYDPGMP